MTGRGLAGADKAMAETSGKKTPRDLLRVVFRRWRLFVLGASLFATAAMLGGQFVPLKYTGETKFERRSDAAAEETARGRSDSFETRKLTLQHELIGFDAVAKAAEDEGLMTGLPHGPDGQLTRQGIIARQELVNRLIRTLKVTWDVRSEQVDLITVGFTHDDPLLAERMPNTLVRNYINRTGQQTVDRLTASRDFLEKQVKECTTRLDESTKKRLEFEGKHAGAVPDNPGAIPQTIERLTRDIDRVRVQNTAARDRLARFKALGLAATGPSSQPVQVVKGPNPKLKVLQEQHRDTQKELDSAKEDRRKYQEELETAKAINRMRDEHPTVQVLKKKITQLDEKITRLDGKIAQLDEEIKQIPQEAVIQSVYGVPQHPADVAMQMAAAESEVEVTDRELQRLQAQLSEYQALLANYAPIRQEYLQMIEKQREVDAERTSWQKRQAEVQMSLAAEIANRRTHLSAVQAAQKQSKPSSPSLLMVLILALGGGLAFGSALVFLTQMMDRSISTTEEAARHFGLPIHGVIEEIVPPRLRARRRMKKWILGPAVAFVVLAGLAVSAVNIAIWLEYHDSYAEWRRSPVGYLIDTALGPQSAPTRK
jgi:uncharacterized protein involved in exopolysaccharide biosynthesis